MVERVRIYVGATELNYSDAQWTKTNDHIVNSASVTIEADANVEVGSIIDFKKADGSTTIFSGQVFEIVKTSTWELRVYTNGYELNNRRVEQVYTSYTPENIVADVVNNYTSTLTYASTNVSGVTISKYIAKKYALDILKDMADLLQWQIRIDENDNVYFEPKGTIDNGVTLTNGTELAITAWEEDNNEMINHVKVIGGFESFNTTETITGVGTDFTLTHKPAGSLKAVEGATEIDPSLYTVDAENKIVTFTNSRTNPIFTYTYTSPIVVENQDDTSIAAYTEIFKEIQAPFLSTSADARRFAQNILVAKSNPAVKAKGTIPEFNYDLEVGEIVTVVDTPKNRSEELIITKITYKAEANETVLELGERDFEFFDWQKETQDRIKKLEQRFLNVDETVFSRLMRGSIRVSYTVTNTWEQNGPVDSFIAGHQTLGRSRSGKNFEADCSNSGHHGTWSGTSVTTGGQYTTSGWRLSAGYFNGLDRYISVADHADLDFTDELSIQVAIRVSALPGAEAPIIQKIDGTTGYEVYMTSTGKVGFRYYTAGSPSTFESDAVISLNTWTHYFISRASTNGYIWVNGLFDGFYPSLGATIDANAVALEVGRKGATYFDGWIDEIRIYNVANVIGSTIPPSLNSKIQINDNMICYLSMDNPRVGDRTSARTTIV